jgi:hypothetical protein
MDLGGYSSDLWGLSNSGHGDEKELLEEEGTEQRGSCDRVAVRG